MNPRLASRTLRSLSVLVIDDSPHMLVMLQSILQGLGIRNVVGTTDPIQGLRMLMETQIDIAFIDMRMPTLSGADLIRQVRASTELACARMPIIAVSAFTAPSKLAEAFDAGADCFVKKPLTTIEIAEKLRSAINTPRAQSA